MDDAGQTVARDLPDEPPGGPPPPAPAPPAEPVPVEEAADPFEERPELFVGAAFAGGLLVALLLRRIADR